MAITKPTCDLFSENQNFGLVYNESQQIIKKVYGTSLALTSSADRLDVGWGGATRLLTIQGVHDGTGFAGADQNAQLDTFIYTIEQWINQGTQAAMDFTSSFGVTYKVRGLEFKWQRGRMDPNRIAFTLVMREGA